MGLCERCGLHDPRGTCRNSVLALRQQCHRLTWYYWAECGRNWNIASLPCVLWMEHTLIYVRAVHRLEVAVAFDLEGNILTLDMTCKRQGRAVWLSQHSLPARGELGSLPGGVTTALCLWEMWRTCY
ncbi:hypothetical protein PR048_018746 [Dryococelus australis]|uniref:Uncharacterized protein n=1 Tax=Dryococelus australis TaxID=614101 RepID=A0ABQ9HD69_9NEOP|nr:hypothetical protein PR048_018746 [Dryococelus australis]